MKTLVVIDDELEMEDLYGLMLEDAIQAGQLNYKFFGDAREFLTWLQTNTPDLVLCDLNMPHHSGIDIGRAIRARDQAIKLYFVSGYEARDYADIMKELGVSHFLSKPLDYEHIINSINSELGL